MSHFVYILLIEALLVLSVSLVVLLIFNGKKKKQKVAEIEGLLAQIEKNNAPRKEQLANYLTNQLDMEEQPAVELVEDFIAAEKRFTQQFLQIQLNQKSVSDFYQNSCEILDKYLQLVADNVPKALNDSLDITSDAPAEEPENVENSEQLEEIGKEQEIEEENKESEAKESEGKDIEPEILESKSEEIDNNETSQISATEAESKEQVNNSEVVEEDEFDEEPDWGDAFAETGEEMDESLLKQDPPPTDSGK